MQSGHTLIFLKIVVSYNYYRSLSFLYNPSLGCANALLDDTLWNVLSSDVKTSPDTFTAPKAPNLMSICEEQECPYWTTYKHWQS